MAIVRLKRPVSLPEEVAALALPLYVRDKVALTTEERDQVKHDKAQAAITAPDAGLTPPH